jgi:hemerythrin-like domain-containing protein
MGANSDIPTRTTGIHVMLAEHRHIEFVLNALSGMVLASEKDTPPDLALVRQAMQFLRFYAGELHHSKEEGLLFPLLIKRSGWPDGQPIKGLLREHHRACALMTAVADSVHSCAEARPDAKEALLRSLREFVSLYRNHIWTEDALVFPVAGTVLSLADQDDLCARFAGVNNSIGLERIGQTEQFARSLSHEAASNGTGRTGPTLMRWE